jgi:Ca2+-binding EF-hand superfamily protein
MLPSVCRNLLFLAAFAMAGAQAQDGKAVSRAQARDFPGLQAAFDIVDLNHDGVLDAAEFDRAMALDAPLRGAGARSARKLDLFRYLDVNGDARISRQEAAALDPLARSFAAFDRNRDGGIDAEEFGRVRLAALARPPAAAPSASAGSSAAQGGLFRSLDANHDGYLTDAELFSRANTSRDWLALDRNGDGLISPSELTTVEAQLARAR